jgi:hypothetical protein
MGIDDLKHVDEVKRVALEELSLTERTWVNWRTEGLFPRPVEREAWGQNGPGSKTWYPAGTIRQMRRAFELMQRLGSIGETWHVLWMEGFPVEVNVRRTVKQFEDLFERARDGVQRADSGKPGGMLDRPMPLRNSERFGLSEDAFAAGEDFLVRGVAGESTSTWAMMLAQPVEELVRPILEAFGLPLDLLDNPVEELSELGTRIDLSRVGAFLEDLDLPAFRSELLQLWERWYPDEPGDHPPSDLVASILMMRYVGVDLVPAIDAMLFHPEATLELNLLGKFLKTGLLKPTELFK